jgi:hypothetical protein
VALRVAPAAALREAAVAEALRASLADVDPHVRAEAARRRGVEGEAVLTGLLESGDAACRCGTRVAPGSRGGCPARRA